MNAKHCKGVRFNFQVLIPSCAKFSAGLIIFSFNPMMEVVPYRPVIQIRKNQYYVVVGLGFFFSEKEPGSSVP